MQRNHDTVPIIHPKRKPRSTRNWKHKDHRREQTYHVVSYYMIPFSIWANEPESAYLDDDPSCHLTVKRRIA